MTVEDAEVLKSHLVEALSLADGYSLSLTGVRIAEAIEALIAEARLPQQGY